MLVVVSYSPLYFCGAGYNFSFVISNFIDSGPLPFFSLMSLAKNGLSILFLFPKDQHLVSLIFSNF